MFKIFQRKPPARPASSSRPTAAGHSVASSRPARRAAPSPLDRPPVPQAQELDAESGWDQWEHSQMELDSRLGPLSAFDSVRVKDASPSQAAELDPFAGVRHRRP